MAADQIRSELLFKFVFSLVGLALLVVAIAYRGWPQGPAMFEVIGIAGAFFGGSALWSGWRLMKLRDAGRDGDDLHDT